MTSDDPERALALSYAVSGRIAAHALFALDDRMAAIVRATRDPLVGQMRLAWWREALIALDRAPPPPEPVLAALARDVLSSGVTGAAIAGAVDGWEVLLEDDIGSDDALMRYAVRGAVLFRAIGDVTGARGAPVEQAGMGWALADLHRHARDPRVGARAAALARPMLDQALNRRWGRASRAIGALAHLARLDSAAGGKGAAGSPRRVARLLRHRLTGR